MNKVEFDEMLTKLLDNGIEITMSKEKDNNFIWYNLNTEMKSHLNIAFDGEKCIFRGRYDNTGKITSYNDLLEEVANCQQGRDFGNSAWLEILTNRYN
jgi:hypothetical protein